MPGRPTRCLGRWIESRRLRTGSLPTTPSLWRRKTARCSAHTIFAPIKKAAALNDAGVKIERVRREPAPVRVPADLSSALKKNAQAQAAFKEFSPSHKREYVEWITDAKTDETRTRRLTQAIEWMAEGKSRNWKYEKRA